MYFVVERAEQEQQTLVQISYSQFDKTKAIIDRTKNPISKDERTVNTKTLEQDPDRDYITARSKFIRTGIKRISIDTS